MSDYLIKYRLPIIIAGLCFVVFLGIAGAMSILIGRGRADTFAALTMTPDQTIEAFDILPTSVIAIPDSQTPTSQPPTYTPAPSPTPTAVTPTLHPQSNNPLWPWSVEALSTRDYNG